MKAQEMLPSPRHSWMGEQQIQYPSWAFWLHPQPQWHPQPIPLALLSLGAPWHTPSVHTCSASQAMCFTSRPPAVGLPEPSVALSSARTCGSSAVMLACSTLNQAWAVAVSRHRSTRVFRLSGECSSISLRGDSNTTQRGTSALAE